MYAFKRGTIDVGGIDVKVYVHNIQVKWSLFTSSIRNNIPSREKKKERKKKKNID